MMKLLRKLRNSKRGFSLVELIVVIAIMAVIAAVLVPSLLMHVEESRAEKDIKTTDEVVTAVELALADQDVYDELVEHSVWDNVSCYVDKDSESGFNKVVIKETYNGNAEQYKFDDDARQNDEVPYYGAGNMRGLTITLSPTKDSNESTYDLSRAIINRFVGRKTGYLYENEKLYNAIRSVVGDKIYNSSQTYRNSDFTIFIRLGSAGGNEAGNQDATQVWGQYNGTNLPADTVQTAKITTDRVIGDAGQYDKDVNDYINDEANTDIDFSKLAAMGGNNFGANMGPQLPAKGKTLAEYTWEEISAISEAGAAREYFSLGDIKTIDIGGTSYEVFIVGFSHDDKSDSSGKAGITFQMVDCLNTKSKMNSSSTNAGGWENTLMRTYLNGDVYNSLSSDLQSVIKTVNKSSDKGKAAGNGAIATTADKLWLFSAQELHGHNYYEKNSTTATDGTKSVCNFNDGTSQYEYFKNLAKETTTWNDSSIVQTTGMFNRNAPSLYKRVNGSANWWWLRSSNYNDTGSFCLVYSDSAKFGNGYARNTNGVCFGFCI